MQERVWNMGDVIFSLDIGTRNVVGMIGNMEMNNFKIIDFEIIAHPDRAMYDGQIHDIDKVSEVVREVKQRLEDRAGFELKYVSIAAAGRALKTNKVEVYREIDSTKEISKSLIDSLEIEAIQTAQSELEKDIDDSQEIKYYCVGYTVVNYYLDGNIIGNLRGHRGNKIGADVLATFLPHVVVDSLYTVVHRVGLEVVNLTLEPIAAINVAIPPKFRLLNLALVDVGAGTSDIAITKDGAIVSYAMVSVAGDEITEAISKGLLLDFNTAEKLKIELSKKQSHKFNDIIGMEYEMTTEEVVSKVEGVIKELCYKISSQIIKYNGKSPSAVFCIGGGSQIPGFTKYLADSLEIPKERVAIRGTEMLEDVDFGELTLKGPEYVTPMGIGYTAFKDREQDFLEVTVNGNFIRLFNSKQLTVSDALILIEYNARNLIAKKGKPITFTLNKKKKTCYGSYGEPAKIYVNSELSSLDTKLSNKDIIIVDPATEGENAEVYLKDIVNKNEKVSFNDEEVRLVKTIKVNGQYVDMDHGINEDDNVEVERLDTIEDILKLFNINPQGCEVYINDKKSNLTSKIKDEDIIKTKLNVKEKVEIINPSDREEQEYMNLRVNGETIKIKKPDKDLIFVELFNHIDFDLTASKGIIELKLNGERANYTDTLKDNDVIEIYWK